MFFTSTLPSPTVTPTTIWYRYLSLGLLVIGLAWLSGRFMPPVWLEGLCRAWLLVNATVGLILAALWLLTDHEVSRSNANVLLLNPLLVLALRAGIAAPGSAGTDWRKRIGHWPAGAAGTSIQPRCCCLDKPGKSCGCLVFPALRSQPGS